MRLHSSEHHNTPGERNRRGFDVPSRPSHWTPANGASTGGKGSCIKGVPPSRDWGGIYFLSRSRTSQARKCGIHGGNRLRVTLAADAYRPTCQPEPARNACPVLSCPIRTPMSIWQGEVQESNGMPLGCRKTRGGGVTRIEAGSPSEVPGNTSGNAKVDSPGQTYSMDC